MTNATPFSLQNLAFSLSRSARGAGPGRNLTVLRDNSDQDRRALSPNEKDCFNRR
jgi:hypothetical protein